MIGLCYREQVEFAKYRRRMLSATYAERVIQAAFLAREEYMRSHRFYRSYAIQAHKYGVKPVDVMMRMYETDWGHERDAELG